MSQDTPGKKHGLSRPIEVIRAELLKDPDTKRIAKAVGMDLEAYVELVLEYAQDKDKQPVLQVMSDAEARAKGFEPKTPEEAAQVIISAVKGEGGATQEFEKSEFQASSSPKGPALSGDSAHGEVPKGNPDLADEVKKGRS
jgi:hypothetical protein